MSEEVNTNIPVTEIEGITKPGEVAPLVTPEAELSPEAKEEMEQTKKLQARVKEIVQALINEDYTLQVLGYAEDLFSGWMKILTAKTEKLTSEVKRLNDEFKALKGKNLTPLHEEAPSEVAA